MKELGPYDTSLQMFVDKPRDTSLNHLRDLRRRAELGEFGPRPLSTPRGDNLFRLSDSEIRRYAMIQSTPGEKPMSSKGEALMAHIARWGDY